MLFIASTETELKKLQCHRCGNSKFLVLTQTDDFPCPCCGCQYGGIVLPIPTLTPERVFAPCEIDIHSPIDLITAQLMAFFFKGGMPVSTLARQMGVARATVYSKLKKYGYFRTDPSTGFTANIMTCDVEAAGRLDSLVPAKIVNGTVEIE